MDTATKATHTPGPWKWDKGVEDDETRCFVTQGIEGRPPYLIAEIQNGAPGDYLETEEANARLIASAPDLLRECKAAAEWLHSFREPLMSEPHEEELVGFAHDVAKRLDAAIAKAEGRS